MVAHLLRRSIRRVTISGGPRREGILQCFRHPNLDIRRSSNRGRTRRLIEREAKIAFGGLAAESIYRRRKSLAGSNDDAEMIISLLTRITTSEETRTELGGQLFEETAQLLRQSWPLLIAVAGALIERISLRGSELRRLAAQIDGHSGH